jgi:3D (Asp-Asp-Asp) domain-containing protein
MRKSQLVLLTIITILFTANIVLTHKMLQKSNKSEQILNQLARNEAEFNTFVRKNQLKMDVLSDVISEQKKQLKSKQNEIHKLKKQLDNAMNNSESPMPSVSRVSIGNNYKSIYFEMTAYTSECYGCSGITFSEYPVHNTINYNGLRILAADLNVLPLYSIVRVRTKDETFRAIVLDKGGLIKNYKLDLLVSSYNEAIKFGRQTVEITILREGEG